MATGLHPESANAPLSADTLPSQTPHFEHDVSQQAATQSPGQTSTHARQNDSPLAITTSHPPTAGIPLLTPPSSQQPPSTTRHLAPIGHYEEQVFPVQQDGLPSISGSDEHPRAIARLVPWVWLRGFVRGFGRRKVFWFSLAGPDLVGGLRLALRS